MIKKYLKIFQTISLVLLTLSGVLLIGFQKEPLGWIILLASLVSLVFTTKKFAKDLLLINLCIALLGLSEISTSISYGHILGFGTALTAVVAGPYLISKYIYKQKNINFYLQSFRKNVNHKLIYIGITASLAYIILPIYLSSTGAYLNWPSQSDSNNLIKLFIGTNGLGIWDELFFVVIVFNILRSYFSASVANLAQSILWTSFLYELGFISWGIILIFVFALTQGYIFYKTHSLFYTISIHLTLDFILYLALVNAHHPEIFNIFIT